MKLIWQQIKSDSTRKVALHDGWPVSVSLYLATEKEVIKTQFKIYTSAVQLHKKKIVLDLIELEKSSERQPSKLNFWQLASKGIGWITFAFLCQSKSIFIIAIDCKGVGIQPLKGSPYKGYKNCEFKWVIKKKLQGIKDAQIEYMEQKI